MGGGEREILYLPLHCLYQNDSCINMGSGESRLRDKVAMSTDHNLFEEKGEPKRNRASQTPYRWAQKAHEESRRLGGAIQRCFTSDYASEDGVSPQTMPVKMVLQLRLCQWRWCFTSDYASEDGVSPQTMPVKMVFHLRLCQWRWCFTSDYASEDSVSPAVGLQLMSRKVLKVKSDM